MRTLPMLKFATVPAVLLATSFCVKAEEPYRPAEILKKLLADYPISVVNAEGGVVTQGVTLVLKQGLTAGSQTACTSDYKDGAVKLTKSGGANCADAAIKKVSRFIPALPGLAPPATGAQPSRVFVVGEKMYVTKIEVKDAVSFSLLSDAISDVTYKADVHFPVAKGANPSADQVEKWVAEMFTIAPADKASGDKAASGQQQAPAQAPAPAAPAAAALAPIAPPPPPPDTPALAPIAPPPPPPDQPPATVSLGMSVDQVVAILGQPVTQASIGAKQIFSYKNLKVTFVSGKVTDVQ